VNAIGSWEYEVRWGVVAQIVGHEHVGASVDLIEQFGRALHGV
jgi:hypothetical protein